MGGLALSTVGFYSIGVSYVQTHAGEIAGVAENLPFDPSLIPGCLLAPDMGALGIALQLAATPALAAFYRRSGVGRPGGHDRLSAAGVSGGGKAGGDPGADARLYFRPHYPFPAGLLVGGLLIGLTPAQLFFNLIPVLLLCVFLIAAFLLVPSFTMRFLIVLGQRHPHRELRVFCDRGLRRVHAGACAGRFRRWRRRCSPWCCAWSLWPAAAWCFRISRWRSWAGRSGRIGERMGVNNESVVGLVLSATQSLAMLPLFTSMDRRGPDHKRRFFGGRCLYHRRSDVFCGVAGHAGRAFGLYAVQADQRRAGGGGGNPV